MHRNFIRTKKGVEKICEHHTNPFGLLVTRKLHWIVLKHVDIGIFATDTVGAAFFSGHAFEIIPTPNPNNGDKLVYFVKKFGKAQHTVATIHHKSFSISFRENSEQEFLDILDKECTPVTVAERLQFCQWMDSFKCPNFDRWKKPLMRYLAR